MSQNRTKVDPKNELLSVSSECEESAGLENGFDEDDQVRRYFKWSPESTKLLLSLRFRKDSVFSNPKSKKKQLWDSIADAMYQVGGYRISGVLCDLKFRNMMHTYKKNRQKENSGNSSLIVWEYYKIFKDAVGHKFNRNRTIIADTMLYDDTMMEAPNETVEQSNETANDADRNIENSKINDREDDTTGEYHTNNSSKRKNGESSFNEDDDYINNVPVNSADCTPKPLTEDERNECTAFGNSVASQLQTIKDSYSRALTKLKMQKILFLAQTGRLALNNERL